MADAAEERKFPLGKKSIALIIAIALVSVIAIGSYFFFFKKNGTSGSTPTESANKTVESVAKLIDLPSETPTIATVSDISKLKDQPFFANAKNGDVVLI